MTSLRSVVVLVQDGVHPFGLGAACEVWAEPYHPDDDNPVLDFAVATTRPGRLRTSAGFDLHVDHDLSVADDADLVIAAAKDDHRAPSPEVAGALRAAHDRGALVLSHCTGVFQLGEAGLLDGRRCTTHWRHAADLAARFPAARVDADVLYVDEDRVITGAGSAASLDASLHLMREVFGARHASAAARRIVVPPHRDGGQAQFIASPVPACDAETLGPLLTWMVEHLDEEQDVAALARRSAMSPRTFARRFRAETGTTPHAWLVRQRVQRAEQLLETTDLAVEQVAHRVGFANAATLRHHFTRVRGLSPQTYRRRFAGAPVGGASG